MKSTSFVDYANAEARKLGLITSLLITIGSVFVFILVVIFQYKATIQSQVKGQTESFGYWVVTNDQFQLSRSLTNLVHTNGLVGAEVLDGNGTPIKQYLAAGQTPSVFEKGTVEISGLDLNLLVRYDLFSMQSNTKDKVGQLQIVFPIRLGELVSLLIVLAVGLVLLNYFIRFRFRVLARSLGLPVKKLAVAVSEWDSARQSTELLQTDIQFQEFVVLSEELVRLATRLRDKEQEISRAEQARDLYEMARHVAHDIRSPVSALNAIVASSQNIPEESRNIIHSVADRISQIANELLTRHRDKRFSAQTITKTSVDFATLLRDLAAEKMARIQHGQVDLRLRLGGSKCQIAIDTLKINRALSNIIDNAVEACGEKGYVSLTLEVNQVFNSVTLIIEDSGGGVPKEVLQTVFDGPVQSSKADGNGLGLHSAIQAIQSEGGHVRIENVTGIGARIHVSFQLSPKAKQA